MTTTATRWLTVNQAAVRIGKSRWTVLNKIKDGELRAQRRGEGPGARYRIDQADLDEWFESLESRWTGAA